MSDSQYKDGMKMHFGSTILYCLMAALVGFVIRAESHSKSVEVRLVQLERRTDTIETDLRAIKTSLHEIRSDVRLLVNGVNRQ